MSLPNATTITNPNCFIYNGLSRRKTVINAAHSRTIRCHNAGFGSHPKNPLPKPHVMTETASRTVVSPALLPAAGHEQIGILNFLKGKNFFVTGATGFLAKVLIEKILRTLPDVGKLYLLIKAKDEEAAIQRLKTDIIDSELFKRVQHQHGRSYGEFMMRKLVPVVGDISKPDLGMDGGSVASIVNDVDVIVSSAANTTFDERFDVALNTNTRGPGRLMNLAKKCNNLCLFLHVSTAYANGEREGVVREMPFMMGQSIAGERMISHNGSSQEASAFPILDLDAEIKLVSETLKSVDEKEATRTMKELATERAKMYGWQNAYVFTKAMGEMVINSMRGDIPVVIIRPSVVESTYKEPFPGWIQGNRMLDPLILSYGKGLLPGFIANPKTLIDVVPADMVVNATIAAMAKHGIAAKPELNVYHIASSTVNPLTFHDVFKFSSDHFVSSPLRDAKGKEIVISEMEFLSSVDEFSSYIADETEKQSRVENRTSCADPNARQRAEKLNKKKVEQLVRIANMYEPYMFYRGWFNNGNMERLIGEMSMEEKVEFGFDMRSINWRHFMTNIHLPGLKRHVLMIKENEN